MIDGRNISRRTLGLASNEVVWPKHFRTAEPVFKAQ
jgi:hypothetical protein